MKSQQSGLQILMAAIICEPFSFISYKVMKNVFVLALILLSTTHCSFAMEEVNLYSARKEALIKPLLDAFTADTGIKVNIISSKADALLKRIQSEDFNSPADVLLTTDAGRLYRAKQAGVFSAVDSKLLIENIPAQYRDADRQWFGLSIRVRPVLMVKGGESDPIIRYEDLADGRFKGAICIRSSNNIYNQSLVASMIDALGEAETEIWARHLVNNMARKPQGGDRDQIRAAAAGQCSIAIANNYYLAQMLANPDNQTDYQAAKKMRLIWPNQDDRGAHVNISGAGVLKHAPHPANALKLIEYLVSDTAQQIYADINLEFPVKKDIAINPLLANWGAFKADSIALNKLGENNAAAVRLMDRAGWK